MSHCHTFPKFSVVSPARTRSLTPEPGLRHTQNMAVEAQLDDVPRLCPRCGATTALPICPADSTATIDLQAFETANWQLHAGQVVAGKYRIVKEIARGGHGTVYRAEHLLGLGTVALKLPGRESTDVMDLRRFFREAQVSARLTGAHTARVFDVGQTAEGALYLAMEFIDGPTLETVLRHLASQNTVMSEAEATRIALDVLDGLTEAHAAGLVHRDLKPSNIAIRRADGAVKILDFGLALVHNSSLTPHERAMGTPHYMSPEQCQGGEVDARADLYALGVVLYRMVVGRLPFTGDGAMAVLWGHVHRPVPDVTSHAQTPVSASFGHVVMRALAKRPERRFASASAMRDALVRGVLGPVELDTAAWPDVVASREGEDARTTSASHVSVVKRATLPTRWVAIWALVGASVAAVALANRPARQPPPATAGLAMQSTPRLALRLPAIAEPPAVAVAVEPTPAMQPVTDLPAPTPHAHPLRGPTAARASAHESPPSAGWKKRLLPQ